MRKRGARIELCFALREHLIGHGKGTFNDHLKIVCKEISLIFEKKKDKNK